MAPHASQAALPVATQGGRRGSSDGRRGRRAAEIAASELSRGQSTRGRVRGPHRPTRLERLGDHPREPPSSVG
eukprot:4707692-Prymnesium_polylepis.1